MQFIDDCFGWDTNSGNEEFGARVDDNVGELTKLALGVVVAATQSVFASDSLRGECILGLARAASDLRKE